MLNFLRNNTKLIIWFVVIIFALLFGVSSFSLRKEDRFAGEMFGNPVTFQDLRRFQILTRLSPPADEIVNDSELARQYTWQQLMLSHQAKMEGLEVADGEVVANIRESFGHMSPAEYEALLSRMRVSPREFEEGVRERLRIQKLVQKHFPPLPEDEQNKTPAESSVMKERIEEYAQWVENIRKVAKPVDYDAAREAEAA